MRAARKPERRHPILGGFCCSEDHWQLSRFDPDEENLLGGVREHLHSYQELLRFLPVFGEDCVHHCYVALNFLLAVFLLWNLCVHYRTVGLFVGEVLELAPTPSGRNGTFVHLKDGGQQPVNLVKTALDATDSKIQRRSVLGAVVVVASTPACLLGCFTLQWARQLLEAEDVRKLYVEAMKEEGKMEEVKMEEDEEVPLWEFPRRMGGRTVAERMSRYASLFAAMALCGGLAMSLLCRCLELHVPGVFSRFLLPWIWSVVLSRPCVHVIWCAMEVGKARVRAFCRRLQKAREESERNKGFFKVHEHFFREQLQKYLDLDDELMKLCDACHCVLKPMLPVFVLGFYCSVMATVWTGKLEYKIVLALMAFGFFLSVVEVLWPMGVLSDACCLTKTQRSMQSIKDEVVRCGRMEMEGEVSQEYLRLLAVVKTSPIGAKLPLLGLVKTSDLYHMALFILPTLPTLVALA